MDVVKKKTEVPKKHRQRGKNRRIGFTQEIITKDVAKTLLSQENSIFTTESHLQKLKKMEPKFEHQTVKTKKKIKREKISNVQISEHNITDKLKKRKEIDSELSHSEVGYEDQNSDENEVLRGKKQKVNEECEDISTETNQKNGAEMEANDTTKETSVKNASKRALKKMKYQKLLEDKKNKLDVILKQRALNYLSSWKHDKINWKFEKLKQIWLLQNLYDATKIEDSFWDTVVEYFSNSKGKVHKTILDEAIKIIENEINSVDDNGKTKLNRARDIIQNLQE